MPLSMVNVIEVSKRDLENRTMMSDHRAKADITRSIMGA